MVAAHPRSGQGTLTWFPVLDLPSLDRRGQVAHAFTLAGSCQLRGRVVEVRLGSLHPADCDDRVWERLGAMLKEGVDLDLRGDLDVLALWWRAITTGDPFPQPARPRLEVVR